LSGNLAGISGIIILGVIAQWIAWRLKLPSILLLLVFGFVAGPVTGFIRPDELFGESLFPLVSLSVALILFEGGLSLKIRELRQTGSVVHRLISVGALVTWFLTSAGAVYILRMDVAASVLLGAITLVTGPTVVVPLLRLVRPRDRVASMLKWEGILIDPIGAVLAVLVFEAIMAGRFHDVPSMAAAGMLNTLVAGTLAGGAGALTIVFFMRFYLIPDFLQSPVTLMSVVAVFTASNLVQAESGLLAVTVMGVLLANQNFVAIKHIIEFKENLRVLLLAGLFIILSARLQLSDFQELGLKSAVFLAGLIVIVRPAAVFVSTLWSEISWRERIFMAFVAPRGIVAASVASVFALQLAEAGFPGANAIASVTFLVIIGTVIVYGLGAMTLARLLNLAQPSPQGMFIVGAYPWSIALANSIKEAGYKVIIADTNWGNINAARMAGLQAYYGSALSENIFQELDLEGVGRILALTPNYGVNSLAVLRFNEVFDRSELYQLHPGRKREKEPVSKHLHGRFLFTPEMTFEELSGRFENGAAIKKTNITEQFTYASFKEKYSAAVPLFLVTEKGELQILTADDKQPEPVPEQSIISLVGPE
jgi:NhaP-type Na+/H+ or K+/H+ antiporter